MKTFDIKSVFPQNWKIANKHLLLITCILIVGVGEMWADTTSNGQVFYFKPSEKWKTDGARFAVCFQDIYGNSSAEYWYSCISVAGATDMYYAVANDAYYRFFFCRMDGSKQENKWDNKWNQSAGDKLEWQGASDKRYNYFEEETTGDSWSENTRWLRYSPPMSSVTISNNSTVYGGQGTQADPYQILVGSSLSVGATATSAVEADENQTKKYTFSVATNNGSFTNQTESTTSTYSFTSSSTAGTTYQVKVSARNEYSKSTSTKGTSKESSTIYYKTIEQINAVLGTFNNWTSSDDYKFTISGTTATATFHLEADQSYLFKVVYQSVYYGNGTSSDGGTVISASSNNSNLQLSSGETYKNIALKTTIAGDYTFKFDTSNKKLTVTYPAIPAMTGTVGLSASGAVKGTGTSSDPYIVFEGSTLTLNATHSDAPTADKHFKYQYFKGNAGTTTATTSLATKLSTASDAKTYSLSVGTTTGKYPLKVSAYYEYGPAGHTAKGAEITSSIIYYQVVANPTVTLAATQTQVQVGSAITLNTTQSGVVDAAKLSGELKYTYEYCKATTTNPYGTYGSWTTFNAASTNATITKAIGNEAAWYKFRVKMTYGGKEFLSNEIMVVNFTPYIITIKETETTKGWFKKIYVWNDNYKVNNVAVYQNHAYPGEMKDTVTTLVDDKTWLYEFRYPLYTTLVVNGDDATTNKSADQTITSNTCLTITGGQNGNWTVEKQDNCSNKFFRVKTVIGSKTYYSNMVENSTDMVSFYANLTDDAKIYIQTSDGGSITDQDVTTTYKQTMRDLTSSDPQYHKYGDELYSGSTAKYEGNVFKAKIASSSTLSDLALYTGNYYIAWDALDGGAADYIKENNKFSRFVPVRSAENEWYNHYFCNWTWAGKTVVATVGNDYNRSLSVILGSDKFCPDGVVPNITNQYSNGTPHTNNGLNIRFAYDNYSNRFERAALMGSTSDNYLTAYGDKLYKGSTKEEFYTSGDMAKFTDISNYTYQIEVYADKETNVVLLAPIQDHNNGSKNQFLLGVDEKDAPLQPKLLSGNSDGRWHIRMIYDYKINRIITAWLVDDNTDISQNRVLDANMMVTRYADTKASVISINGDFTVSDVHKVYTVLEFTKEDMTNVGLESGDYLEASFWICLPYDCTVSEVFGISNYNPDGKALDGNLRKWQICRYAGDKRAANGWYKPTATFWYMQEQDGIDYMHAYQGYAVNLKLHKTNDFKTVSVQKKNADGSGQVDANGNPVMEDKTLVRLYFPSREGNNNFELSRDEDKTVELESYICQKQTAAEDRRHQDSNWHLTGNPTYGNARVTSSSVRKDYDWNTYSMTTTKADYTFLYKYNFKKRGDSSQSYVAFDATSADMYPTFAYMAQWAGTMHWTANSSVLTQGMRRRVSSEDEQIRRQIRLQLQKKTESEEEFVDQTYINLTDNSTELFDLNLDLEKIRNYNGDLYSISLNDDDKVHLYAANSMPVQDRTVMLGVQVKEDADYLFSMPDETQGMTVSLYDSQTKEEYNLLSEIATIHLAEGEYENRFMLIICVTDGTETVTSIDNADNAISLCQREGQIIITGLAAETTAVLYDAVGKQVFAGKITDGASINTPAQGVYLLQIGNDKYKIVKR